MSLIYKIILILSFTLFISCNTQLQNIGKVNEDYIRIGTFNIEWLGDGIDDNKPRTEKDYKRISDFILSTKVDILGVEEIENETAIKRIVDEMPGYSFKLLNTDKKQNCGIIYKNEISVSKITEYSLLKVDPSSTRPALVANLKIRNNEITFLVAHFKSTSRWDSTEELKRKSHELRYFQSKVLNSWIDSCSIVKPNNFFVVLGDLNDNPNRENSDIISIKENNNIQFLTDDLKSCKNPKWFGIDHIIISKSLLKFYNPRTRSIYNSFETYNSYESGMISDHCPVLIGLELNKY